MIFFKHSLITFSILSVAISGIFANLVFIQNACQNILRDYTHYKNDASDFNKYAEVKNGDDIPCIYIDHGAGAILVKDPASGIIRYRHSSNDSSTGAILISGYRLVQDPASGTVLDIKPSPTGYVHYRDSGIDGFTLQVVQNSSTGGKLRPSGALYRPTGIQYHPSDEKTPTPAGMAPYPGTLVDMQWIDIWLGLCFGPNDISGDAFVNQLKNYYSVYVNSPNVFVNLNEDQLNKPFKSFCEEKIQTTGRDNMNLFFIIYQEIKG